MTIKFHFKLQKSAAEVSLRSHNVIFISGIDFVLNGNQVISKLVIKFRLKKVAY